MEKNKIWKLKENNNNNNKCLFRVDDFSKYFNKQGNDKILAWTNKAVQYHNFSIAGKSLPEPGDIIYCSNFNQNLVVYNILYNVDEIITPYTKITNETKYNPLHTIKKYFKNVIFIETNIGNIATVFGSYNYKIEKEKLANALIEKNKKKLPSKEEYKLFKTFEDCVMHTDFPYAITIHKSQGQEWDNVFIDNKDLSQCKNTQLFLKLLYVAFSRARDKIYLRS
jgi:superfamily I DNA/RNA helicase